MGFFELNAILADVELRDDVIGELVQRSKRRVQDLRATTALMGHRYVAPSRDRTTDLKFNLQILC